jgi:diguanylate cyclase (GGDEF)-like protein
MSNLLMLGVDALLYFVVLAGLFHARHRLGIGAFFCALGVLHFLETYLASTFYVALPGGIVVSPGSTILFSGKLLLLLLVYIREDAVAVRQPIYGLLIGNLLVLGLAVVLKAHDTIAVTAQLPTDFKFLDEMGLLMLWGTMLLFIDSILIIVLYERAGRWVGDHKMLRIATAGAAVLSFDQLGFWAGLRWMTGAPVAVLVGGWVGKMGAGAFYTVLLAGYLRLSERPKTATNSPPRISDVFSTLTYRERYEELVEQSARDPLTGVLNRGRLETEGRRVVAEALAAERPVSVLVIDIDHFKQFNDLFGHGVGDVVLTRIAGDIVKIVRANDLVFRYGGEEFVVVCDGLGSAAALSLAERVRQGISTRRDDGSRQVTVSVGIASTREDGASYDDLFSVADHRLLEAKAGGRNRVVGITAIESVPAGGGRRRGER